jgi:hypothetical protein
MIDLSPLTPETRRVVQAAAPIYLRYAGPHFVGLLIFGSAFKGGVIPGSSDLDLKLYLADAAFADRGQLPLALCMAIQRDLSRIDPAPFRYIQCDALPGTPPPDQVGPVPGTYHVVAGRLPVAEATAEQIRRAAHRALTTLDSTPAFVTGSLLEHGGGRLSATVRLLCTRVWPTLYNVLTLRHEDAFGVWRLPKERAIEMVPAGTPLGSTLRTFYNAVRAYYPAEASVEQALAVVEHGVAVLQMARRWYEQTYNRAR